MDEERFPDLTWAELPAAIERRKKRYVDIFGDDAETEPFPRGIVGFDYLRDFAVRLQSEADVQDTIPDVHHQVLDLIVTQDATGKNIVTAFALQEDLYLISTRLVRQGKPDGGERIAPLNLEAAVGAVKQMVRALKNG